MRQMGFYISSLSRTPCTKSQVRHYQVAPSYNYKWTDIHYEASRGNVEKLSNLLATLDRDLVDKKDYYGKTPLYWAAYKGQKLTMELLLQHGASVNSCCKHGGTPLHAAIGLFPDCVLLLIQHGADVNLQDNWGVTPMYLAACSGQMECIRLLVLAGADITYKNKWCRMRILERIEWRAETEPFFVSEKTGSPPKRLASQTAFISWIESFSRQPRSLKHLSRLAIRAAMGHQRLRSIKTFNLPLSLKGYLMFEDLVLQDTP